MKTRSKARKPLNPFAPAVAAGKRLKREALPRKAAKRKRPKSPVPQVAPQPEYVYAQVRLPKNVFNVLQRAAEIAEMEQTHLTLALVAVALARAELAGAGEVLV